MPGPLPLPLPPILPQLCPLVCPPPLLTVLLLQDQHHVCLLQRDLVHLLGEVGLRDLHLRQVCGRRRVLVTPVPLVEKQALPSACFQG